MIFNVLDFLSFWENSYPHNLFSKVLFWSWFSLLLFKLLRQYFPRQLSQGTHLKKKKKPPPYFPTDLTCKIYAAAAAKSLQSCLTLCDPIDSSPLGSPVLGILQARILEWVAISFSNAWKWKVKVKSLSHVWFLATPWTADYQAPPSMGFSREEYWSGVPLPSPKIYAMTPQMFGPISWSSIPLLFPALLQKSYCCSATESCLYLFDPMDSRMTSLLVPHYLLKFVL